MSFARSRLRAAQHLRTAAGLSRRFATATASIRKHTVKGSSVSVPDGVQTIDIEVWSAGEGSPQSKSRAPLLMVHGGFHGAWCWENFLGYFAEQGYEAHALSWRGHGGSTRIESRKTSHTIADVVEDVHAVVKCACVCFVCGACLCACFACASRACAKKSQSGVLVCCCSSARAAGAGGPLGRRRHRAGLRSCAASCRDTRPSSQRLVSGLRPTWPGTRAPSASRWA